MPPLPNPVPGGQKLDSQTSASDKSSGSSSELTMNTTSPNVTVSTGPHTSDKTDNKSKKEDNGKKSGPSQGNEIDNKTSPTEGKETDNRMSPPQRKEINKKPTPHEGKEIDKIPSPPQAKDIDKKLSPPAGVGNCDGKEKKCLIHNTFTGCIGNFGSGMTLISCFLLHRKCKAILLLLELQIVACPYASMKLTVLARFSLSLSLSMKLLTCFISWKKKLLCTGWRRFST